MDPSTGSARIQDAVTPYWSDEVSPAYNSSASVGTNIGLVVCASVLMAGSILANLSVFIAIGSAPNLRQRNNVLILSLAASDLLRGAICLPLLISILIGELERACVVCVVFNCFRISLDTSTLLHIALVSLERGFVISSPLIYERIVSRKKMIVCVVIAWVVSFCYGIPQMVWSFNYDAEKFQSCYVQAPISFIVFDFLFRFVLPLLCIVASNCKICHVVNGHIVKMQATVSSHVSQTSRSVPTGANSLNGSKMSQTGPRARRDRKSCPARSGAASVGGETSGIVENVSSICQSASENQSISDSTLKLGDHSKGLMTDNDSQLRDGLLLSAVDYVRRLTPDGKTCTDVSGTAVDNSALSRSYSMPQIPAGSPPTAILRRPSAGSVYGSHEKRHSVTFQIHPTAESRHLDDSPAAASQCNEQQPGSAEHSLAPRNDSHSRRTSKVWTTQEDDLCSGYYSEQQSSSSSATSRSSRSGGTLSTRTTRGRFSNNSLQRNKAAKLTIALIVTFVLCYLPLEVCSMLYSACGSCIGRLPMNISVIIALSSSLLHPLVYNFYSHEFRKATKEAFLAPFKRKDG